MFKRIAVACAAAAAAFTFATPASASVDDFAGQWVNQDTASDGVTRVSVSRGRGGVRVRVFGRCHPSDCDWGEATATPFASSAAGDAWRDASVLIAQYNADYARRTVILRLTRGGVDYEVFTDFTDSSRRADYFERGRLLRGGIVPPGRPGGPWGGPGGPGPVVELGDEDCVGFNNANLRVVNVGGRWKLADGSHWVADFGGNRANADRALEVARRYGFTSQCFVARPNASMTYWLRGSSVPGGAMPGEDCITVNPANVRARLVGGAWKVTDGDNWLLDFGANRDNAQQAAAVIQHYNMNRQCFVGRPNAPMQYWLSR